MKSVGEVMSIGRSFHESLQKALISLDIGLSGLSEVYIPKDKEGMINALSKQNPQRIIQIAQAIRHGMELSLINKITKIDFWFLERIKEIIELENYIRKNGLPNSKKELLYIKSLGFTDMRLSELTSLKEVEIYELRKSKNINAVYKRVDTCAGEFISNTSYMYSTYPTNETELNNCESNPSESKKIIILGGGPNRIGQGIEFDYCCCHACFALSKNGIETVMINCNPETVSTDYDTSDRLYFEPLTVEHVMEIIVKENSNGNLLGVIVQLGGQTPLNLSKSLKNFGITILGTSLESIDISEDREKFKTLLCKLGLKQPNNGIARSEKEAIKIANKIDYPVVIRPSYVIGGRAMEIVLNEDHLKKYINHAVKVSGKNPILVDSFISNAIEIDVDAISDGINVTIVGLMQHIEEAGIHSGDSACCIPPYSLDNEIIDRLKKQSILLAKELQVVGLINIQFAINGRDIYVLEANPRASRTLPFVSKVIGKPIPGIAALIMAGISKNIIDEPNINFFAIKEVVLPFNKFPGTDILLGPEMRSTGEVMGIDKNFAKAYLKSQIASGIKLPNKGTAFVSVKEKDKSPKLLEICKIIDELGINILATTGTLQFLSNNNINAKGVNKAYEGRPNIIDLLTDNKINLVINTTEGLQSIEDSKGIRMLALEKNLPYYTSTTGAWAAAHSMKNLNEKGLSIISLQELNNLDF